MHHRQVDLSHFRKPLVKGVMALIVAGSFPHSDSVRYYLQNADNHSDAKCQPTDTYHGMAQRGSSSGLFTLELQYGTHAHVPFKKQWHT